MCVTNIYTDRYPDGKDVEFRQTSICQYGQNGRTCPTLSTLENPIRKIQWGEPSTEFMLTQPAFQPAFQPVYPQTPPRSSGGSHHRHSGGDTSSSEGRHRRHSKILRPHREHRKSERIIIVDSPPTPRTPPQIFNNTFTAPSSPVTPPYVIDGTQRGRPIIVDERSMRHARAPSVVAVVSERPRHSRSHSRPRFGWDSPSSSHTSFDSRARREQEEREREERRRKRNEREERQAELEVDMRRAQRIAEQNEAIRQRAALPPAPLKQRAFLRPVIDQSEVLQDMMGGLVIDDRRAIIDTAAERRRREDLRIRQRLEALEDEAMKQRLRERQLPKRRSSVGPGHRRTRVLYDDGLYRWE